MHAIEKRAPLPCEKDPDLFFPVSREGPSKIQIARAQAECRSCPILPECLADAFATDEIATLQVRGGQLFPMDEMRRVTHTTQAPPVRAAATSIRRDTTAHDEEVAYLRSFGMSHARIAERLGLDPASVERADQRRRAQQRAEQAESPQATAQAS